MVQNQKNRNDGAGEVGAPTNPMKAQPSIPCKVRGAGANPARGIISQRKRVDGSGELRAVGIAEKPDSDKKKKGTGTNAGMVVNMKKYNLVCKHTEIKKKGVSLTAAKKQAEDELLCDDYDIIYTTDSQQDAIELLSREKSSIWDNGGWLWLVDIFAIVCEEVDEDGDFVNEDGVWFAEWREKEYRVKFYIDDAEQVEGKKAHSDIWECEDTVAETPEEAIQDIIDFLHCNEGGEIDSENKTVTVYEIDGSLYQQYYNFTAEELQAW